MDFQIVSTKVFTVKIEVAITPAGHRWRYPNAYMPFSTEVYGSVDEAFDAAVQFAHEHMVPVEG